MLKLLPMMPSVVVLIPPGISASPINKYTCRPQAQLRFMSYPCSIFRVFFAPYPSSSNLEYRLRPLVENPFKTFKIRVPLR